ncbi:glycosyltransferase family 87 protein [Streptomyces sp. NPDC007088]|uniref:glycosyltransferase family 87 protein n=1 Tax=Streptomyces sp. NPDC007088 TaxID=3364773 RepID=UPI00369CEEB5
MTALRTPALALAATTAALAALCVTLVVTLGGNAFHEDAELLSYQYGACWLLFGGAALALRHVPLRAVAAVVLTGGIAVTVTGLVSPPTTSTDSYRYVWDGRVQAAGISPYDHAPADPALAALRDPWLFPVGPVCAGRERPGIAAPEDPGHRHCTRVNRPREHTIYPPVAEVYFAAVDLITPASARHKALQTGGVLLSTGVTLLLLRALRRLGRDPRTAAYWAWCPAVPVEAVNNAHVDVLGVLLAVAALGAPVLTRGPRTAVRAGLLIGAATATKMLPAVLLPGALSGVRRPGRAAAVVLSAAGLVALVYLPYLLLSHASVLGYLTGYVHEEGYEGANAADDDRYTVLRLLLPADWAPVAVVLVLLALVGYVLWRGDPRRPWRGALLVTGGAFLLLTPGYSWYALLVVGLVALDGRWEWLGVAVAGAAAYVTSRTVPGPDAIAATAYALAAAAVLAGALVRLFHPDRDGAGGTGIMDDDATRAALTKAAARTPVTARGTITDGSLRRLLHVHRQQRGA